MHKIIGKMKRAVGLAGTGLALRAGEIVELQIPGNLPKKPGKVEWLARPKKAKGLWAMGDPANSILISASDVTLRGRIIK